MDEASAGSTRDMQISDCLEDGVVTNDQRICASRN